MQRALARSNLQHAPAARDLQSIEQRMCRRIPDAGLMPQAGGLSSGVAEEIAITGHARSYSTARRHEVTKISRSKMLSHEKFFVRLSFWMAHTSPVKLAALALSLVFCLQALSSAQFSAAR